MRISIEKALTATGVGVVDFVTGEYLNGTNFGPVDAQDAVRFSLALGSWLVNYMGYERDFSEVVFYSSMPLVVDSIAKMIKKETTKSAASTAIKIVSATQSPAPTTVTPSAGIPP